MVIGSRGYIIYILFDMIIWIHIVLSVVVQERVLYIQWPPVTINGASTWLVFVVLLSFNCCRHYNCRRRRRLLFLVVVFSSGLDVLDNICDSGAWMSMPNHLTTQNQLISSLSVWLSLWIRTVCRILAPNRLSIQLIYHLIWFKSVSIAIIRGAASCQIDPSNDKVIVFFLLTVSLPSNWTNLSSWSSSFIRHVESIRWTNNCGP